MRSDKEKPTLAGVERKNRTAQQYAAFKLGVLWRNHHKWYLSEQELKHEKDAAQSVFMEEYALHFRDGTECPF